MTNKSLFQEATSEETAKKRLRELAAISIELTRVVARNVNSEPELLRDLAVSEDAEVRQGVAGNPNTPTDILWKLGEEFPEELLENPLFSLLLLENPNLFEEIPCETLCNLLVLENVPISFLEWGAKHDDEVTLSLTINPKTPKKILNLIGKRDWMNDIFTTVKQHINWSGEISEGWEEFFFDEMKNTILHHYCHENYDELWSVGAIDELYAYFSRKG